MDSCTHLYSINGLKRQPPKVLSQGCLELAKKMQIEPDIPFQVRLPESLAKRVKMYSAASGTSHKALVMEALQAYLKGKES